MEKKFKLSLVSGWHYARLAYRSLLWIVCVVTYIIYKINKPVVENVLKDNVYIFGGIGIVFVVEMVLRFFPSKIESPGCQKQFERNYQKTGVTNITVHDNNGTMLVGIIWIVFNLIFGVLYALEIIDEGILIILSCTYSVCDMICILFFCPFQTLFLKNKCCSSCRIYNWDYAMIFTPLAFIRNWITWILVALSLVLFLRWEITFYKHPERFSETTNEYLKCANCTEKLCQHKKQLKSLWEKVGVYYQERIKKLKK